MSLKKEFLMSGDWPAAVAISGTADGNMLIGMVAVDERGSPTTNKLIVDPPQRSRRLKVFELHLDDAKDKWYWTKNKNSPRSTENGGTGRLFTFDDAKDRWYYAGVWYANGGQFSDSEVNLLRDELNLEGSSDLSYLKAFATGR